LNPNPITDIRSPPAADADEGDSNVQAELNTKVFELELLPSLLLPPILEIKVEFVVLIELEITSALNPTGPAELDTDTVLACAV